jgi:hypothetical protein
VPETTHIGAYPCVSKAANADRANRKSPANQLVLVLYSLEGWPNCHAEGRGFESHQPLLLQIGAFRCSRKAETIPAYRLQSRLGAPGGLWQKAE